MNSEEEHLFKGIHWYLHENDFLNKNHDNILFIGTTENMKEDLLKLSDILEIKLDENKKLRENVYVDKSMKYLSPLAIQNIINWYKNDYAILKELLINGWISESIFNMYSKYEYN
jgi:hypothetical protein